MLTGTGGVTVMLAWPVTFWNAAEIATGASRFITPLTRPLLPEALLTVANDVALELHVACVVTFCVELSENTSVAWSCSVLPLITLPAAGVTSMRTGAAGFTVTVAVPST
jgi:hypothetical protein